MNINPFIKFRNIYVIPTFHSRIEFAKLVRTALFKVFPDVIAVELPHNVKEEVLEAIERLPYLSLIGYADTLNPENLNYISFCDLNLPINIVWHHLNPYI